MNTHLLIRARNMLSHPSHWFQDPEHIERRRLLTEELTLLIEQLKVSKPVKE